jgi:predicted nucleotidyltransferase
MVTSVLDLDAAVSDLINRLSGTLTVEAVILYGSYARGTAHEWSDIDLAVISPDFEGVGMGRRQEILARLMVHANPFLSPLGYPSSEYHNPGPHSFLGEIIRTGRVVYPAVAA